MHFALARTPQFNTLSPLISEVLPPISVTMATGILELVF